MISESIERLLSIGEISGVFVGFAALVTVVAWRSDRSEVHATETMLMASVIGGVVVVASSLIPVVLQSYHMADSTVWRSSSAILFAMNLLLILGVSRITRGYSDLYTRKKIMSISVWLLEPVLEVSLILCILGLFPHLAAAFYLTAVVVLLIQVALAFVFFVAALADTREA